MKTTNKILSIILAVAMLLGMLPMISLTAHAAASKTVTIGDLPYTITVKSATSRKGEDILDEITSIILNENTTSRTGNTVKIWNLTLYGFGTGNSCEFTDADCGQNLSVDKEFVRGNDNIGYTKVVITITRTAASHTGGTCISQNCTRCGNTYDAPHDYKWKNDGTNHWQECTRNASHIISRGTCSGGTATCHTLATCDTCKYTYGSLNPDNHEWTEWEPYTDIFSTKHYRDCIYHTDIRESGYCDPQPNCSSQVQCSICYVRYPIRANMHNWGTWESNGDGTHTRICTLNNSHKETAVCSGDSNATCRTSGTCTACGASYIDKNAHRYTYTASGNTVTQECSNGCGHTATAKLTANEVCYTGYHLTPATVEFSDNWAGAEEYGEVTYSNNIDAGTATAKAMVAGIELTTTFRINAATISDGFIILGDSLTYNGATQTQTVKSVTVNGVALTEGIDYTISGNTAKDAGTYTLTITGINNAVGTITKNWKIAPKSVTTSATVQDKVYDGTTTVDSSAINITLDGIIDGDDVVIDRCAGLFLNANAGNNKTVQIAYYISGEDVDNYEIYEDYATVPENEFYYIETKANILPKDISDAQITLGDALTFNAEEQAQTIESVTVDGLDVTYTVSGNTAKNVGVYQLTVTGTGNFTGEATALYEIAVDVSGLDYSEIDGYYWSDVKSTDKDRIEYVYNQINNAEWNEYADAEKKAEWNTLRSNCYEMLLMINSVTSHLANLKEEVAGYDVDTVTSDDYDYLEGLYESEAQWLYDFTENYTDEEIKEFSDTLKVVSMLKRRITETKSEYERVIELANGYDPETVTSADMDALIPLNEDIYNLAITNNVTAEEKANLQTAHDKVLGMIDKLTGISDEIKRIIEEVDKYVFESVKSTDKADIEQLIKNIADLLVTQNLTDEERALLENADEICDKLIAKIGDTVKEIERIDAQTNAYDPATVTSADKSDIEALIAAIKILTDGDNITAEEETQLEGNKATLEALLAIIKAVADEIEKIEDAVNSYDEKSVKSTDKEALEQLKARIKALTDKTNITDEERANLTKLDATIDALLKKIEDTQAEIERIDEAVDGYDIKTVNSGDVQALGNLIEGIETLTNGDNITEEEKAALEEKDAAIDELIDRLAEVAEEIAKVNDAVNSYDENSVKSSDSEDLEQLKEDIQAVIDCGNVSENEIAALEEMIADVEALEDKIAETEEQLEKIQDIENGYDPETVTSDDKEAIETTLAEIDAINPDNLTDEQKAEYEEIKEELEVLLDQIADAQAKVENAGAELGVFDEDRVTIFQEEELEAYKAKVEELLANANMGEAEKAKLNEYNEYVDMLIETVNNPADYFSARLSWFVKDCLNWKWDTFIYYVKTAIGIFFDGVLFLMRLV